MTAVDWKSSFGYSVIILLFAISTPQAPAADWSPWLGPAAGVRIRARLRDKDENARNHQDSLEVEVQNAFLHPPNAVAQSGVAEGELKYQIDECPAVVTTDTRITLQQIPAGAHTISVALVGWDNRLIVPPVKLPLEIP